MLRALLEAIRDEVLPPRVPRGVEDTLWNRRESLKHAYGERVLNTTNPCVWGAFHTREPNSTDRPHLTFIGEIVRKGGYHRG